MADVIYPIGTALHAITAASNVVNCTLTISPQSGVANRLSVGESVWVTGTGKVALDNLTFTVLAVGSNTVQINNGTAPGTGVVAGTVGRRYTDPLSWEVATSISMGGNRHIGRWYDDDGLGTSVPNFAS